LNLWIFIRRCLIRLLNSVFIILHLTLALYGCAGITKTSEIGNEITGPGTVQLCGVVEYSNYNTEYIPRSLHDDPTYSDIFITYKYEVKYGIEEDTAFDLFNPFLIFGVKKSEDAVVVNGQLNIKSGSNFEKEYRETVILNKSKTLYSEGGTLSELRRKGLIQLRDKIDALLISDKDLFINNGISCNREDLKNE
jgi:hypothetical protein